MNAANAILGVLIVLGIIALNAFFVAAEFAIVKVRATQITPLAREGSSRARVAQHVLGHLDVYLSACQLGITMTSLALGWVGEPFVAQLLLPLFGALGGDSALLHTVAVVVAFTIITYLHIVLGEQAPKWLAIQHARATTLSIARPLDLFARVFRPFIWFVNASAKEFLGLVGIDAQGEGDLAQSEEELRLMLSSGKSLTRTGKDISLRAIELRERAVREVMIPRTSVAFLSTQLSIEANLARAVENQFTRYPLCEGNLDNVLGMIHIKDLFRFQGETGSGARLSEIMREILFVPETTSLERMLNQFLARRILMAVVVDEYGGTAGIVTLENVLEELVGEIRDEFDTESAQIQKVAENEYLIDGSASLHDFGRMFDIPIGSKDIVTVSGYAIAHLGRVPEKGAVVGMGAWTGTVESVEKKQVKTLRLVRTPPAAPAPEASRKRTTKQGGKR